MNGKPFTRGIELTDHHDFLKELERDEQPKPEHCLNCRIYEWPGSPDLPAQTFVTHCTWHRIMPNALPLPPKATETTPKEPSCPNAYTATPKSTSEEAASTSE